MKYYSRIRSRHPSHNVLRKNPLLKFFKRTLIRLGSTSPSEEGVLIEINSINSIMNSANKKLMKECFTREGVITAPWIHSTNIEQIKAWAADYFPIVAKSLHGSRGTGNHKLNNLQELNNFMINKTLSNYIFEKFHNYVREYRLHVSKNGCFYTCRKMLKRNCINENSWQRHDDNCVWILEENPLFDKPKNWDLIVEHSVKALKSVGLDIGAIDMKVQSKFDSRGIERENPEFIIIEINSAPSFGEKTQEFYIKEYQKLILEKINNGN